MKTKRIYTVIWTHDDAKAFDRDQLRDCTENQDRFSSLQEAGLFCRMKRNHGEPATVLSDDVPVHIAKRWGF